MTDHAAHLREPLEKLMLDADMPRAVRTDAADAHAATDIAAVEHVTGLAQDRLDALADAADGGAA